MVTLCSRWNYKTPYLCVCSSKLCPDDSDRMTVCSLLLVAVLAFILDPSAYGADATEDCITSFMALEKAVLSNPGNVEALVKAFYKPNNPLPLSVQVVYHVNSSNGTHTFISTDPNCSPGKEMWLWVPSPVLIFIEPTKLNMFALYTLNYFRDWTPPRANILLPNICNIKHNRFNFLNALTVRVSVVQSMQLREWLMFHNIAMLSRKH